MRLRAALLAGGLLLVAVQAVAEGGPRPEAIAAFVAAVTAAGCAVTPENQAQVVKASGLSGEVAASVVQRLEDDGRLIAMGDKRLVLQAGECK